MSDPNLRKAQQLSKGRVMQDYSRFKKAVDVILQDDTLADADLKERAMRHLETLSHPNMLRYNRPETHLICLLSKEYNMKGVLEAIYGTAYDLRLKDGGRYVLAAICACANLPGRPFIRPGHSVCATRH